MAMGILTDGERGHEHTLDARMIVGRSPACALAIQAPWVSGEHALLSWDGEAWTVRDLASSNGTFVDGVRVPPGGTVRLGRGERVGFGRHEGGFTLLDDGPPVPSARAVGGSETVRAAGTVLLLPSEEAPEVSLFLSSSGGWVQESDGEAHSVADRDLLSAGGQLWRVYLPTPLAETLRVTDAPVLHFRVSRDEEFASLVVEEDGRHFDLGKRGYTYLLLTLARQRLADGPLPDAERGWVHQDDLARMLRLNASTVNVQIHRARQHASKAGMRGAAGVVERRHRTRQLRIGSGSLTVTPE